MSITITQGAATATPAMAVDGYTWEQESGNVVHQVLGASVPAVSYSPLRARSGSLTLMFDTATAAALCVSMHAAAGPLHFVDTAVPFSGMDYVAVGTISRRLDPTSGLWLVTVPYQDITL